MRIKLELEDFRFVTTADEFGAQRWLVIEIAGQKFYVQRLSSQFPEMYRNKITEEAVDRVLIEHMQVMLESMLLKAAAECPDGEVKVRCPSDYGWSAHYDGKCMCAKKAAEYCIENRHGFGPEQEVRIRNMEG